MNAKLYFKATVEIVRQLGIERVAAEAERRFRRSEEFYEYVSEPEEEEIGLGYYIVDNVGFTRHWRPGDVIRPADLYIVVVGVFEVS